MSLVALLLLPGQATNASGLAAYFFMWALFTFCMFIGTLRLNKALQVVFGSLVILFLLLFIKEATGAAIVGTIAGYEGIICGLSAIYAAVAQILNDVYGRVVLSIGPVAPAVAKPTGKVALAK